jgi:hypothetical protein
METLSLPTIKRNGSETTTRQYPSDFLQRQVADRNRYCLQTKHNPPLSKPLTIHLDALLDASIDQQNLVAVSFETYRVLIDQLEALGIPDTVTPTLSIPLELSEALIVGPFDAETLVEQINYNQPPSLYLTERSLQTKLNQIERYDFPLRTSELVENTNGIYVKYHTGRALEDIENGWEYGRSIVAEYYPKAYQYLP